MRGVEAEVAGVNEAFYRAFRERDIDAMDALWARESPVACIHPGMGVLLGRQAVMGSWRGILRHPQAPTLVCSEVQVHVLGTSAYVTCLEGTRGTNARLIATNVFTLENGRWRLVHHHAAPLSSNATPDEPPDPVSDPHQLN